MPSLKDDQQKAAFGEALTGELKIILEYVKGIPALEEEIIRIYVTVNDISNRLNRLERVGNDHGPRNKRP